MRCKIAPALKRHGYLTRARQDLQSDQYQKGKRITVKVTGRQDGYATITKTSASTAKITLRHRRRVRCGYPETLKIAVVELPAER